MEKSTFLITQAFFINAVLMQYMLFCHFYFFYLQKMLYARPLYESSPAVG